MTISIGKNYIWFITICLLAMAVGAAAPLFLPEKYYGDAITIATDPYNEIGFSDSYPLTIYFYEYTGLNRFPFPVVAIIQIPILFFVLYLIGVPGRFQKFTLRNLVAWLMLLFLAVFISMPSKEFINFIYMGTMVLVFTARFHLWQKLVIVMLMLAAYGVFFRLYYLLVPVFAIGLNLVSKIRLENKIVTNVVIGLAIACFLSFSYGVVSGKFLSQSTRTQLNKQRNAVSGNKNAETAIISPVETDTWGGETLGIVYGFFSVNFPLNSLRFFYKPQVIAFMIWQLLLTLFLIYDYAFCLKNRGRYDEELWVFHIVIGYFILQGVFEADLGSAIKHKLGVIPFLYAALYFNKGLFRKRKDRWMLKAKTT